MKKVVVALGLLGIMASLDAMNDVRNGLIGLQRDIVLRLCRFCMLPIRDHHCPPNLPVAWENVRVLLSISGETYGWRQHDYLVSGKRYALVALLDTGVRNCVTFDPEVKFAVEPVTNILNKLQRGEISFVAAMVGIGNEMGTPGGASGITNLLTRLIRRDSLSTCTAANVLLRYVKPTLSANDITSLAACIARIAGYGNILAKLECLQVIMAKPTNADYNSLRTVVLPILLELIEQTRYGGLYPPASSFISLLQEQK